MLKQGTSLSTARAKSSEISLSSCVTPKNSRKRMLSRRSEGFLAPGPATDHLVPIVTSPKGITKSDLLAIAQQNNLQKGLDANAGLQDFLPPQAEASQPSAMRVELRKEPGFRPPTKRLRGKTKSLSEDVSFSGAVPQTPSQYRTALLRTAFTRRASPVQTLEQVKSFIASVTLQIPHTADKLNKRCILSKEANRIRARTMASVKINMKVRQQQISRVQSLEALTFARSRKEEACLRFSLEAALVDKLAAAEIETIRKIEREAVYPKLTNEQIQQKLGRLRSSAESHLSPLQSVSLMEIARMENRRIR